MVRSNRHIETIVERGDRVTRHDWAWIILTVILAFVIFLTTLQWRINGSQSPYATDVGEIQNALPRWGTLHFTGYPLYTLLGSLFVTALRVTGIEAAAGASLFSALWGAIAAGLMTLAALELDVASPMAALSSIIVALATSVWIDASLAEVHTMTMALTLATLIAAIRFGRSGSKRDLLWLALAFTQGVAHQRAIAFLAPAILALIYPHLLVLWHSLWSVLGISILAPLTYLYLPFRAWGGAEWTFGQPGTWHGFWTMIIDTKSGRIISAPTTLGEWWFRSKTLAELLNDDLPLLLIAIGLAGLLAPAARGRWRESLGLVLAALLYLILCLVIWEGRVSDALLAAKLPIICLAGLGLALLANATFVRWSGARYAVPIALVAIIIALFIGHRPTVLAITRDPSSEEVVNTVEQLTSAGNRPITFMALWGHDYWALTYAQAYRGQLAGLHLTDHNADFATILGQGDQLLTLSKTFYERPLTWWDEILGPVHLASAAPGIIEIAQVSPLNQGDVPEGSQLDLDNGIHILSAQMNRRSDSTLTITLYWQAQIGIDTDYSVAVHLLANNPPQGPQGILAQADRHHPVEGWYPTSRWQAGEIIRDDYVISIPANTRPVGVRVGMYRVDAQGRFLNTEWLFLPMPSEITTTNKSLSCQFWQGGTLLWTP